MTRKSTFLTIAIVLILIAAGYRYGRHICLPVYWSIVGKRTTSEVLRFFGDSVSRRLKPFFDKAEIGYPPSKIALLAFKAERVMELWGKENDDWRFIKEYEIQGASGEAGPKLKRGDRQVPEGIYGIEYFNPNSKHRLSMKLDYPNEFDRKQAEIEGRTDLGGDIFIHGGDLSAGCLAMGDEAIEELFVLSRLAGRSNVKVIVSPKDFRERELFDRSQKLPKWLPILYSEIDRSLKAFNKSKEDLSGAE